MIAGCSTSSFGFPAFFSVFVDVLLMVDQLVPELLLEIDALAAGVCGSKGVYLKQQLRDKLIDHKEYIDKYGEDMPEIRNWKWNSPQS